MAQLSSADIAARYPAKKIDSVARATAALDDVARARVQVAAQLAREERACAATFFTTRCLDLARERRHAALARLRPIEVEANMYKRRARVDERDQALAQKAKNAEPEAPQPITGDAALRPGKASVDTPAESRAGGSGTASRAAGRATPHQAKSVAPAIGRATEEANMAAFDRKAKESAQRQAEIAAKKTAKDQDRARRKAAAGQVSPTTTGAGVPN